MNELLKSAIEDPGLYWYVAPSYRQAKSISWVRLKELLKNARVYWKFNEQELYAEHIPTRARIELKGADNEESLLGVGLKGVVFDETAMTKEAVWSRIVRPMLADSKGWAIFISTPKGKNWFYEMYLRGLNDNEPEWKSWRYPTKINRYISLEEIANMKKEMPERLFAQEILAEFTDDDTSVFKRIKSCIAGDYEKPVEGRFYVIGIDLAKTTDFTVLTVLDSITRQVVAFDRFQDVSWREQKIAIQNLSRMYNHALCFIDATGVGDPILEDLQNSRVPCEGVKFNNTNKKAMIEQLAIAIEQRQITFPHIHALITELEEFGYEITQGGVIRYSAPEGKHDDCVISLALAVHGIRTQLHEAQIVKQDEVWLSAQDRQGMGDLVNEDEEITEYAGY